MRIRIAFLSLAILAGCSDGSQQPIPGPDGSPVRSELLGMNLDPQNPTANPPVSELERLHITRVRFTFRAGNDLQAAFASYDPVISGYTGAGIAVLMIIDSETLEPPGLPSQIAGTDAWINYIGAFADRAQKIAAHYNGQIEAFEIWNEEDLDDSLPGRHIEPEAYAQLLNETYDRIHKVAGTPVLNGGLASGQTSYVDRMGDFKADGLATHPYLHWPGDSVPPGFYRLSDHINAYSAYYKPLWFTEWGTNDQALQPKMIEAFYSHPELTGNVTEAYFFGWSDTQDPGYGITTDGTHYKGALEKAYEDAAKRYAPPGPDAEHGAVKGIVYDASNGRVVHPFDPAHPTGVTVYCAGQEAPVHADGTFEIDNIKPNAYGFSAVNNWGELGAYNVWATTLNVRAGKTTTVEVKLAPSSPPATTTGSVRGTVYDVSTNSVVHPRDPNHAAGITIYCAYQQVHINSDGTYQIDNIPAGSYGIAAVNNYNQSYWYQTWTWTVSVEAGQTTTQDVFLVPN